MLKLAHIQNPLSWQRHPLWTLAAMVWASLSFLAGISLLADDEKPAVKEFEAKAVLVYHFAKFTSWPEGTFLNEQSPIKVAVYGDKGFYEVLKKYHGRSINGRPLSIHHIKEIVQDPQPQILYVTGKMDAAALYYINNNSAPTLTVGETKEFAEKGGILSIVREEDHLTLYANLQSAVKTKLYLNNNLVKLAKQVTSPREGKD